MAKDNTCTKRAPRQERVKGRWKDAIDEEDGQGKEGKGKGDAEAEVEADDGRRG